jgi:hypothetical protein
VEVKKAYSKPELVTRSIQLGVFGEYGGISDGGDEPHPIKVIIPFDFTIE